MPSLKCVFYHLPSDTEVCQTVPGMQSPTPGSSVHQPLEVQTSSRAYDLVLVGSEAPQQPTSRSCYLFFQPSLESGPSTLASSPLAKAAHSRSALFPRSSTSIHPLSLSSQDCPSTLSKCQECTHTSFASLNLKISKSTGQNPDLLSEMDRQSQPLKKKKACHAIP